MRGGYYRPAYLHTLKAGLDAQRQHRRLAAPDRRPVDPRRHGVRVGDGQGRHRPHQRRGRANLPYAIPNVAVDLHSPSLGVPVLWWRSVGSTHTAYLDGDVRRRAGRRRRQGPGGVSQGAAREASAARRGARARRRKGRLGQAARAGQGRREARPRRRRARVVQHRRRAGRGSHRRQGRQVQASTASCAPSIAASRSIPTSYARRWKAASASACRRRCTARSR